MTDKLLRIGQVVDKVGLSRTTIWRLRQSRDFPEPAAIHGSCIAWSEAEVDNWIRQRLLTRRPSLGFRPVAESTESAQRRNL